MLLDPIEVQTKEVLEWKGLHLFNFSQSSCSQKVRILLREKGLPYRSREIDLKKLEHTSPWYLGINPRGVVPVLIDDGNVHIESNDILTYLEERYPSEESWIPSAESKRQAALELLEIENALHEHLRVITMGFLAPRKMMAKSEAELDAYLANGPDDSYRKRQVEWWREFARKGVSNVQVRKAVLAFHDAFSRLEQRLNNNQWLVTDHPTVVDIAWFINIHRAALAGYPLERHPTVRGYYCRMLVRPAFRTEINKGPLPLRMLSPIYRFFRRVSGSSLAAWNEWPVGSSPTAQIKEVI